MKLEGFDPATGKLTWKVPVGGPADLLLRNVANADAHRIVVTTSRPPACTRSRRQAGTTVGNTFIWAGKDALEAVVANP